MIDLWQRLADQGLTVTNKTPEATSAAHDNPWYIRLLHGFCGWLASWFILGFLALGFSFVFDHPMAALPLGLIINAGAVVFFRKKQDSDFLNQMVLVFSLVGQLLVGYALFDAMGWSDRMALFCLGVYQLLLLYLIDHAVHRYLMAFFGLAAVLIGLIDRSLHPLAWLLISAGFTFSWLHRSTWRPHAELIKPLAVALAVMMLVLAFYQSDRVWYMTGFDVAIQGQSWLSLASQVGMALLVIWSSRQLADESGIQWQAHRLTVAVLLVLVAVLAYFIPKLLAAVLLLLMGKGRSQLWMQAFGVVAALFFFSWYYYWLEITLLQKSGILLLLGLIMLLAFWTLHPSQQNKTDQAQAFQWPQKMAALTALLALVLINYAIIDKEKTIDGGERIYLPLAPVDPRSLMQGDYMRLRYALGRDIGTGKKDGVAVINLDEQQVATFAGLYQGESLAPHQRLIQFKTRKSQVKIGSQEFFFQEGHAPTFDQAAFGELVLSPNGKTLLVGLRDANLKLLGENRLD